MAPPLPLQLPFRFIWDSLTVWPWLACSPGQPWICGNPLASVSLVLRWQICATTPGFLKHFLLDLYILFSMYEWFVYLYMCDPSVCLMPKGIWREHPLPWIGSSEPPGGSAVRTTHGFNCWVISPVPALSLLLIGLWVGHVTHTYSWRSEGRGKRARGSRPDWAAWEPPSRNLEEGRKGEIMGHKIHTYTHSFSLFKRNGFYLLIIEGRHAAKHGGQRPTVATLLPPCESGAISPGGKHL